MKSFQTLGILPELAATLQKQGITAPTPIQEKTIPMIFNGKDLIAMAQTGTGKTLAFLLPILQRIKIDSHQEQALIMAPTRELTQQIAEVAKTLAPTLGVDVLPLIGGKTIEHQLQQLHRHPQVIIGTPGRLLDHCQRTSLNLGSVCQVVLDEADQMLHMGFLDEVSQLIDMTTKKRQLLFFSATIPDKIRALSKKYMQNPTSVTVLEGDQITLDAIEQRIYMINENKKFEKLTQIITEYNPYLAIIFCNTKDRAAKLSSELISKGFNLGELHGDLTQGQRTQVLRDFSTAKTQYLVATDLAARGIDIEGITHIFNYDVPRDVDYYIHRIGRTGRAGQTGIAITFATPLDTEWVRRIERHIEATITKYTIDGKVKVKAAATAPKKENVIKNKAAAASTYQSTKAKAAKQIHGGVNNRRRRVKDSGENSYTQRKNKR